MKSKHSCVFIRVRLNVCLHYYRQQFPFTLHIVSTKSLLFYCVFRTASICLTTRSSFAISTTIRSRMHQWQSFLHCGQSPGFRNINLRSPGSFVQRLLVAETKFQDKFAGLRQVNSSNSQDKFQICCTDMHLVKLLVNFAVFRMFLSIPRDFADIPESRGSATA